MHDWWRTFYDREVALTTVDQRSAIEVGQIADTVVTLLGLRPGDRVFDQCCGTGLISLELARRGLRPVAVDQAAAYVECGRGRNPEVAFEVADAFQYVAVPACHGAFCWGTSYGNAASDEDNLRMLERAFQSLQPGGRYLLDYPNFAAVLANFQERLERLVTVQEVPHTVVRVCRLDLEGGFMRQDWTIHTPHGPPTRRSSRVRLYLPDQLAAALRRAGFVNIRLVADAQGAELDLQRPRCLALATRP